MAYTSWSVVFGEQPSAAKWNILGTNDASFNDGTGIADQKILSRHLAPTVILESATADVTINSSSSFDITGATSTFTPAIASYAMVRGYVDLRAATTANDVFAINLDVDGVNQTPVISFGVPTSGGRFSLSQEWLISLSAVSHTLKLEGTRVSGTGSVIVEADSSRLLIDLIGNSNVTNS